MDEQTRMLTKMIGNPFAYAVQQPDGSYQPVRLDKTERPEQAWLGVLDAHLRGTVTAGTYVNYGDRARTLVFDIDTGDKAEVSRVVRSLKGYGVDIRFVGVEVSGRKGFHVWVLLNSY